ncbi:unnamed protein product, partial [Urochloa humidicola]
PHHVFTSTVPTSHLCCRPRSYHARRRFSLLLRPAAPHAPTPSAAGPRTAAPPHPRPLEIARSRSRPSLVLLPALAPADAVALPYPPPKRSGATWLLAPGASPTPPQRMELFDGMVQPIFRSTGSSRCGNSPRLVESQQGSLLEGPLGAYSEVRRRGFKQQRRPPPPTRSSEHGSWDKVAPYSDVMELTTFMQIGALSVRWPEHLW